MHCRERTDLPIFAKQGDSGSPNGDGSARPIDVPHCESNLGTLGKVWILDWQPQPLIPAAQHSEKERGQDQGQCKMEVNVWGTDMFLLRSYPVKGFASATGVLYSSVEGYNIVVLKHIHFKN